MLSASTNKSENHCIPKDADMSDHISHFISYLLEFKLLTDQEQLLTFFNVYAKAQQLYSVHHCNKCTITNFCIPLMTLEVQKYN